MLKRFLQEFDKLQDGQNPAACTAGMIPYDLLFTNPQLFVRAWLEHSVYAKHVPFHVSIVFLPFIIGIKGHRGSLM